MGVTFRGWPWISARVEAVHWSLREVTAPTVEPITLAQAQKDLGIDDTFHDAKITRWITAARQQVERDTSRFIARATYDLAFDGVPADGILVPPYAPISSITSLTVYDVDDVATVADTDSYRLDLDSEPPRILLFSDSGDPIWDVSVRDQNAAVLRIVVGPDETEPGSGIPKASPPWAVQALVLLMSYWHRRDAADYDAYERVIGPYRLVSV